MKKIESRVNPSVNRRSFLKTGMLAGGAATVGAVLAGGPKPAFAERPFDRRRHCRPTFFGDSRTHRS